MALRFDDGRVLRLLQGSDGPVARALLGRALRVERRAKMLCPVDTGRLRASITHDIDRDHNGIVAWVGSSVKYAAFVERGTRRQHAQPYLRPALAAERR